MNDIAKEATIDPASTRTEGLCPAGWLRLPLLHIAVGEENTLKSELRLRPVPAGG
jgi:hypothetical protein